jgi:predicted nucleic acid-binding protein
VKPLEGPHHGCQYLLDTNVLSEMQKSNGNPGVKDFTDKIPLEDIFISVLSIGEIFFGIEKLPEGRKKAELSLWLNSQIPRQFENRIIPIDIEVMLEWGRIRIKVKKTLPAIDNLLAATALAYHLTLLTRNTRDFAAVEGISLINPWD